MAVWRPLERWRLRRSWRITERYLEQAIAALPADGVLECEDGSLERCRDWLQHNEFGLVFEELDALAKVNDVPREFWVAMLAAAEAMGFTESAGEFRQTLSAYSA